MLELGVQTLTNGAGDTFTTRDVLNVVLSAVGVTAVIVLRAVWQEIVQLRRRTHFHGNWLLDHEFWNRQQGKPEFDNPSPGGSEP